MCDTRFPKHFHVLSNIIKYDGKTNPSSGQEDYRLTCKEGRADDDFIIIQFLPIYLADSARAWLETSSIAGRISERSSPATSRARTCGLAIPGT
jgi:hypothetical protein